MTSRTHPLRNALRLNVACLECLEIAVIARDLGARRVMRIASRHAVQRARSTWRSYVNLPRAA